MCPTDFHLHLNFVIYVYYAWECRDSRGNSRYYQILFQLSECLSISSRYSLLTHVNNLFQCLGVWTLAVIMHNLSNAKLYLLHFYTALIGYLGWDNDSLPRHVARLGNRCSNKHWGRFAWATAKGFDHFSLGWDPQHRWLTIQIDLFQHCESYAVGLVELPWTLQGDSYGVSDMSLWPFIRCR